MSLSNTFAHKGRQFIRYPKGIAVFLPNIYKKVFHNGEFIMGFTDSFRMGQLLQYKLQIPPQHEIYGNGFH